MPQDRIDRMLVKAGDEIRNLYCESPEDKQKTALYTLSQAIILMREEQNEMKRQLRELKEKIK